MNAGEIYEAPSGKKYEAVSDETLPAGSHICNHCECMPGDCAYIKCTSDNIHFKLKEDQQ